MQLVVELDALKEVGKAVSRSPRALAEVEKLIASSPSLVDVTGLPAAEAPPALRSELLDLLIANAEAWHSTETLRAAAGARDAQTLLPHLKKLNAEGQVESRKRGRGYEWRAT